MLLCIPLFAYLLERSNTLSVCHLLEISSEAEFRAESVLFVQKSSKSLIRNLKFTELRIAEPLRGGDGIRILSGHLAANPDYTTRVHVFMGLMYFGHNPFIYGNKDNRVYLAISAGNL